MLLIHVINLLHLSRVENTNSAVSCFNVFCDWLKKYIFFNFQIQILCIPTVLPSRFLCSISFSLFSNLPSRFVSPQTGSSSRYMGQQNSPVPSPYTPQSPATGYIQPYPHQQPPSYNQHQQIQQGECVCCISCVCIKRQESSLKY